MLNKNEQLEHIKKLEKRIHSQRIALRQNWQIIDERFKHKSHYLKPKWFEMVMKQNKIIKELTEALNNENKRS